MLVPGMHDHMVEEAPRTLIDLSMKLRLFLPAPGAVTADTTAYWIITDLNDWSR